MDIDTSVNPGHSESVLLAQVLRVLKDDSSGAGGGVTSFNTRTGTITLTGSDVSTAGAANGLVVSGDIEAETLSGVPISNYALLGSDLASNGPASQVIGLLGSQIVPAVGQARAAAVGLSNHFNAGLYFGNGAPNIPIASTPFAIYINVVGVPGTLIYQTATSGTTWTNIF